MYRYYLTQRPPAPGTVPGVPIRIESFDGPEHVEEIDALAWGWVEYESPLTTKEVRDYELVYPKVPLRMDLTKDEVRYLLALAVLQCEGAADNMGTRTPIHVVERRESCFYEGTGDEWMCEDADHKTYKSFDAMIEELRKTGKELPPYDDVVYDVIDAVWIEDEESYLEAYGIDAQRGHLIDTYRPVAFFFLRVEADKYMREYQAHNCRDCRVYTYGLGYSNDGDLPVFRALLVKMGEKLLEEGGTP